MIKPVYVAWFTVLCGTILVLCRHKEIGFHFWLGWFYVIVGTLSILQSVYE